MEQIFSCDRSKDIAHVSNLRESTLALAFYGSASICASGATFDSFRSTEGQVEWFVFMAESGFPQPLFEIEITVATSLS